MTHLTTLKTLPLLDLSQLDGDARRQRAFLDDLRAAARDVGFLSARARRGQCAECAAAAGRAAIFALPEADKLAVQMVHSPHFRGYNRAAAELTRGQPDWREQFDIGAERPALTLSDDTPRWARLQAKPVAGGAADAETAAAAVATSDDRHVAAAAAHFRFGAVAAGAGFRSLVRREAQRTHQTDSLPGAGRYRQRAGRRRAQGLRLSQLPAAGRAKGLQVEVSEGRWIDAQPREDTFVVNIGELLELATNGYLRATVHRVETPPAGATGCRSPSSSARAWTRWCRCINCRRR